MVIDIVLATLGGHGGTEIVVDKVANGLVKLGHCVRVICCMDADCGEWTERLPGYYYYYEHTDVREDMEELIEGYNKILDRIGNPDMMLATTRLVMVPTCQLVCRTRGLTIPVVSWFHVTLRTQTADLYRQLLPYADAHLAISSAMYRDLADLTEDAPVYLVNNPIAMKGIAITERKSELQLVYMGRICIEKRVDILLAALSLVHGNWHLTVVGDGELREELEEFAHKAGIAGHITWTGWVSNPWEQVKTASLLVLPSDYEGFCMTAVEGLIRGIPVAISDLPGPTDYVVSGQNGWLLGTDKVNELACLLNGIIGGKIALPSQQFCRESVLQYEEDSVIRNFAEILLTIKKQKENKERDLNDTIEEILCMIRKEQWEDAEAAVNEALQCVMQKLRRNPSSHELYYSLGDINMLVGNQARALLSYENALFFCKEKSDQDIIAATIEKLRQENPLLPKKTAIILVSFNGLAYTKLCVDSIRMHNPSSAYELIIVDNASTDGSIQWLSKQENIKLILNDGNKGFPAACNQGIKAAEEDSDIFLLNNDTVMMANSLYSLRMGLYGTGQTGAVGAVSNCVTASQQIEETFDDLSEYLTYSKKNNLPDDSRHEKRIKLIGFAYLIKREAISKTGLLDENFGLGHYEDDDISLRILQEGYSLFLCRDAFIYHFGNISFAQLQDSKTSVVNNNHEYFVRKWKIDLNYYIYARNELIAFLPKQRSIRYRILEIGCACGATLLKIADLYPLAELYGIELDETAASIGACHSNIVQGNIEDKNLTFPQDYFDYIIFGDILEHLHNPGDILQYVLQFLKPAGNVIASIPNIMNHTVLIPLLQGRFEYQDAGILDKTHLKFFTLEESLKLFLQARYQIDRVEYIVNDMDEETEKFIDSLCALKGVGKKELFQVYQFLISAKKA